MAFFSQRSSLETVSSLRISRQHLSPFFQKKKMFDFIFIIDGPIAGGKSESLKLLEKQTLNSYTSKSIPIFTIQEPLEKWQNCNGKNLLKDSYDSSGNFQAEKLQMRILSTLLEKLLDMDDFKNQCKNAKYPSILAIERSFASAESFIKTNFELGKMDSDWAYLFTDLCKILERLLHKFVISPTRICRIVLEPTNDILFERIAKRSRPGEENISILYMNKLKEQREFQIGPSDFIIKVNKFDSKLEILKEINKRMIKFMTSYEEFKDSNFQFSGPFSGSLLQYQMFSSSSSSM